MLRRSPTHRPPQDLPCSRTVRVLRSDEELAQASERAAVHARRLQERLEARAIHDAWSAAHPVDGDPAGRTSAAEVPASKVTGSEVPAAEVSFPAA